jgi:hypothetical protein
MPDRPYYIPVSALAGVLITNSVVSTFRHEDAEPPHIPHGHFLTDSTDPFVHAGSTSTATELVTWTPGGSFSLFRY